MNEPFPTIGELRQMDPEALRSLAALHGWPVNHSMMEVLRSRGEKVPEHELLAWWVYIKLTQSSPTNLLP